MQPKYLQKNYKLNENLLSWDINGNGTSTDSEITPLGFDVSAAPNGYRGLPVIVRISWKKSYPPANKELELLICLSNRTPPTEE